MVRERDLMRWLSVDPATKSGIARWDGAKLVSVATLRPMTATEAKPHRCTKGDLAAVVLVTDGADNSNALDAARIAEIAGYGVPVHTVGVGAETLPDDLELEDVQVPSVGLAGSTVSAQVSIRHSGAKLAQLKVYDGDAIIASEAIQLPNTTGVTTRWVDIDVGQAGVRDLRFALDALPGETNVVNNSRLRPMEVPEQRRHILYIEGEPRWEYKFIRRAIDDGPAVRVASLLKTTPNKFYRQGVESPDELVDGFPTDELTLFRYDALMIGIPLFKVVTT